MTVLQFLRDRYCGKEIAYYTRVEAIPGEKNKIYIVNPFICILKEWTDTKVMKNHKLVNAKKIDLKKISKVIAVNPYRNRWQLDLLNGDNFFIDQNQSVDIVS